MSDKLDKQRTKRKRQQMLATLAGSILERELEVQRKRNVYNGLMKRYMLSMFICWGVGALDTNIYPIGQFCAVISFMALFFISTLDTDLKRDFELWKKKYSKGYRDTVDELYAL